MLQRDQAKAMLSKQAVKIATKAEEHERFIFKVISFLLPPLTIPFLCKSCCHLNKSCRAPCFYLSEVKGLLSCVSVISPVRSQFWWPSVM